MVYNVHDEYVGRALDLYGEYSEAEVEMFRQVVRPGSIVVEAGANLGAHTVFLAQHVGPNGRVLAYEPQRMIFQLLAANLALNNIPTVTCRQEALGREPGRLFVPPIDYSKDANFAGIRLGGYEFGDEVPVVTLDSVGLARCEFLKVDVEGMERQVLEGARDLIARCKPVLYVENQDAPEDLARYIRSLEYTLYWHHPPYFNPHNFFGNSDNVFGDQVSQNMLCVHNSVSQAISGLAPVFTPPQSEPAT
jgi:FkbM family methyltransferase